MKKIQQFLDCNGATYLFGIRIYAGYFCIVEFILSIVMSVIGASLFHSIMYGVLLGIAAFAILPLILIVSNQNDNQEMLSDMKRIFEMLKIQIRVGMYMMDAIENCVAYIHCKRLKQGLNRLICEIYLAKDMKETLDDFNATFSNQYIDTLVVIMKQAMETGYSIENLNNAFEQIVDVEHAINIRIENSIERNTQILQILFMSGIIAIAVFCSFVEFQTLFQFY